MRGRAPGGLLFVAAIGALAGGTPAGARSDSTAALAITGGTTTIYQTTSDARVEPSLTASADLVLEWTRGPTTVRAYFEGSSTSAPGSIAGLLPEANTDAGTALDRLRRGRVQVSELLVRRRLGRARTVTVGLVDPSGSFDQSRIASDEATQFLGVGFTQNPTIAFPDYTLGVIFEDASRATTVLRAALTSSNGLADNPAASYAQLVSVAGEGKGAFLIASVSRPAPERLLRVGAWVRTGDHPRIDGTGGSEADYGAYGVAGRAWGRHRASLRAGLANPRVSLAGAFAALGYQYAAPPHAVGAGFAHTFLSSRATDPALGDASQAELYLRREIAPGWFVTADAQWLRNSAFDRTRTARDASVGVFGLRLTALLE